MNVFSSSSIPEIPDHEMIRRIGAGSYGEVWLARTVLGGFRAVKIVHRARFEKERPYDREFQGIQKVEPISRGHPGLVDILQVGRNDAAGYFYYVMELADDEAKGQPFNPDTYSARTLNKELTYRGRFPALEAIEIGYSLTAALTHLHKHGLVHRDIKPANIVFIEGEPKLADIGLVAPIAVQGSMVGTAGFIPPEGPGSVRADIFALGKVLYELNTGEDQQAYPAWPEALEEFPDVALAKELNEVVSKACAPQPEARYETALQMRADLETLRGGGSVRRLRVVERRLQRVKRVAIAAVILAVGAVGFALAAGHLRAREAKLLADAHMAAGHEKFADGNLHGAVPLFTEALRLRRGDPAADTARVGLGTLWQQAPQLLQLWDTGHPLSDGRFSPDGRRLLLAGGRRAWLMDIETGATSAPFTTDRSIETAVFSPDGRRVAIAQGNHVQVDDVATGTNCFSFQAPAHVNSAEFSPDGRRIVAACADQRAYVISGQDGTMDLRLTGHNGEVLYAAFSPDGSLVATAAQDGTACLWDAATGALKIPPLVHAPWVHAVAFSPDGRRIATASSDRTLRVWHVTGGLALATSMEHRSTIRRVSYSPDGRFIVSAGFDQSVRVWEARTGRPAAGTLNLHARAMQAVFDPDSRRVATVGRAGEARVWRVEPEPPKNLGRLAVVSGDTERYVTVVSNRLRFWAARDDTPLGAPRPLAGPAISLLCDRTGGRVLVQTAGPNSTSKWVHVMEPDGVRSNSFVIPGSGQRWWLEDSGARLLTAHGSKLFCWDTTSGSLTFGSANLPVSAKSAVFSGDGGTIVVAGDDAVLLLNATNGASLAPPLQPGRAVRAVAISPDSRRLAMATSNGKLQPCDGQLWDVASRALLGRAMSHADEMLGVCFSHDGRLVATVGQDNRAGLWQAATGTAATEPISFLSWPLSAEFSPDDRWLVVATWYGTQVCDTRTGRPITPPFTDTAIMERAGFCAGGRRIWVQTRRGVLVWNLPVESRKPDELFALAHHLGVTVPFTLGWTPEAYPLAKLLGVCATERARTDATLDAWRRERADAAEGGKDWFAARFYLAHLANDHPDEIELRERLQNAQAWLDAAGLDTPAAGLPQ